MKGQTMIEKYTEPKRRAQLVRQCIEAAKILAVLAEELSHSGDDLTTMWNRVNEASESILRASLKVKGVRVAVFPAEEAKEDAQ
jgi:predicted chitinase